MSLAREVRYPNHFWGSTAVERLVNTAAVAQAAPLLRGIIAAAYAHAYEKPAGPLPRGTIASRYNPAYDTEFTERAVEHHERGSQYWVIREDTQLIGFVKMSPGDVIDPPKPDTVYINDVVVLPHEMGRTGYQRRGMARTMLHAALSYGEFNEDHPIVLEAFEASEDRLENGRIVPGPNTLYGEKMGLARVGPADPMEFPNGAELWMCEYRTAKGEALRDVVQNLEAAYPNLITRWASE